MQEMAGSTEADFSASTDDLFIPESTPVAISRFFAPMIEIEIAFVMKHALKGPGILPVDVIRATDFVLPAIEIVDFRVARAPGMNLIDTVADLAACGAVVLGANPRPLEAIRSEEHTSELQSLMRISYAVFCLKKKTNIYIKLTTNTTTHMK